MVLQEGVSCASTRRKLDESAEHGLHLAMQKLGIQSRHGNSCHRLKTFPGTCPLEVLTLL